MVVFMLNDAGPESISLHSGNLFILIKILHQKRASSLDIDIYFREAQTTFFSHRGAFRFDDPGIDEDLKASTSVS